MVSYRSSSNSWSLEELIYILFFSYIQWLEKNMTISMSPNRYLLNHYSPEKKFLSHNIMDVNISHSTSVLYLYTCYSLFSISRKRIFIKSNHFFDHYDGYRGWIFYFVVPNVVPRHVTVRYFGSNPIPKKCDRIPRILKKTIRHT